VIGSAIGGAAIFCVAVFVVVMATKWKKMRESAKVTHSGVVAAVHAPDLSTSAVLPPTPDGVSNVDGDAVAVVIQSKGTDDDVGELYIKSVPPTTDGASTVDGDAVAVEMQSEGSDDEVEELYITSVLTSGGS